MGDRTDYPWVPPFWTPLSGCARPRIWFHLLSFVRHVSCGNAGEDDAISRVPSHRDARTGRWVLLRAAGALVGTQALPCVEHEVHLHDGSFVDHRIHAGLIPVRLPGRLRTDDDALRAYPQPRGSDRSEERRVGKGWRSG